MKCLIKNIPSLPFGIAGNRGIGFPLVDYCSIIPQIYIDDSSCFLVKEEDGSTALVTEELEQDLLVTCVRPEVDACFLVLQEDRNTILCQQENRLSFIYCSQVVVEKCFFVLEDDRTTYLVRQEDPDSIIEIGCPEECYIIPNNEANNNETSEDDDWFTDQQGGLINTTCIDV
jgi:hypothetical protein